MPEQWTTIPSDDLRAALSIMLEFYTGEQLREALLTQLAEGTARIRRTKTGTVCYFCGSTYDENGASVACCLAANEWNAMIRRAILHRLLRQHMRET